MRVLDKKTINVLKVLRKLSDGTAYKVTTSDEVISMLSQKSAYDADTIKQIFDYLSKQEYLIIKFSEENTYCYSLLPKANILLEQQNLVSKPEKQKFSVWNYVLILLLSFVGCLLALLFFFNVIY